MWLREQGHVFDWGTLRWCQAYTTPPNGCYDVETIALDEFGHVEILNHHVNYTDESDYARRRRPDRLAGQADGRLERPRARPLRRRHAPAPVRHAELGRQVLDLPRPGDDAGPERKPDGRRPRAGPTTLTATLKVADVSSYVRLALNPIAPADGHPPATAGRDDDVDDGRDDGGRATSGTYTTSVSLQARTEFRAVFNKPADEGLRSGHVARS